VSTTDPEAPGRPSTTAATAGTAARRAARGAGAAPASTSGAPPSRGSTGSGRRGDATARRRLDPDALAALEEERDFLLASLDDLEREHDAGDVGDDDYEELKDDYTARAAAVLRSIEARRALARDRRRPRSWPRIAAWVVLVTLVAVLGGVLVARASGNRPPGGQASGDIRLSSRDLLLEAQQFTGQATQLLESGDAQGALESYRAAIESYQRVLELQPANAEALTYQGWVLHTLALNVGDEASAAELELRARARLDEAIASDPTYPDARVFRAIILRTAGELDAARADLAAVPDGSVPAFMEEMVTGLRQSLDAAPPPSGGPP
jgi:tetratricopeptide (TPR) repeat protein